MSYLIPSFLAATAILIAADSSAQSRADTMLLMMDGVEHQLSISHTDPQVISKWEALTPDWGAMNIDGFIGDATNVELQVNLVFGVYGSGSDQRITEPSIMILERGTPGAWDTSDRDEDPVITVTTYEKSDAGVLVEGTFLGTPDLRSIKIADHGKIGEIRAVSGTFSILYPAD